MIYLIKAPSFHKDGCWYKVGHTMDLEKRMKHYQTDCPEFVLLDIAITYKKTKHQLETAVRKENETEFQFSLKREWFFVPNNQISEFDSIGLKRYKACRDRKIVRLNIEYGGIE